MHALLLLLFLKNSQRQRDEMVNGGYIIEL